MPNIGHYEIGTIGLIQEQEDGRIAQIGLTDEQSRLLQIFLSMLSEIKPIIRLPEEYDLVLKINTK